MRFATEATRVRFPARVLAIASVRASASVPAQAAAPPAAAPTEPATAGSPATATKPVAGRSISTAGTFETTVESSAVTTAVWPTTSSGPPPVGSQARSHRWGRPVSAIAPTTTNRPANRTIRP